jgi:methionyl-tRNA synthetase
MVGRYLEGHIADGDIDAALVRDFAGLCELVEGHIDRAELTLALDEIWQRVRRLNRYVEERAPWELARDAANAAELDQTLASLAEGVRVVSVLLHPYMPDTVERLLDALGAPGVRFEHALFAERGSGATVTALDPLFPKRDK